MADMKNLEEIAMRKSIVLVAFYLAVMAAGLHYVNSVKNVKYSDPGFIQNFIWILFGLAILTLLYSLLFRREVALPVKDRRWVRTGSSCCLLCSLSFRC